MKASRKTSGSIFMRLILILALLFSATSLPSCQQAIDNAVKEAVKKEKKKEKKKQQKKERQKRKKERKQKRDNKSTEKLIGTWTAPITIGGLKVEAIYDFDDDGECSLSFLLNDDAVMIDVDGKFKVSDKILTITYDAKTMEVDIDDEVIGNPDSYRTQIISELTPMLGKVEYEIVKSTKRAATLRDKSTGEELNLTAVKD